MREGLLGATSGNSVLDRPSHVFAGKWSFHLLAWLDAVHLFGQESPSAILLMQFCFDERRKTADDDDPEHNHRRRIENERETKCRSDDAENNERQVGIF